jgi:hypothetical protein
MQMPEIPLLEDAVTEVQISGNSALLIATLYMYHRLAISCIIDSAGAAGERAVLQSPHHSYQGFDGMPLRDGFRSGELVDSEAPRYRGTVIMPRLCRS